MFNLPLYVSLIIYLDLYHLYVPLLYLSSLYAYPCFLYHYPSPYLYSWTQISSAYFVGRRHECQICTLSMIFLSLFILYHFNTFISLLLYYMQVSNYMWIM